MQVTLFVSFALFTHRRLNIYSMYSELDCLLFNVFLVSKIKYEYDFYKLATSIETTFDPLQNLGLILVFFAPGTRETFSPGL